MPISSQPTAKRRAADDGDVSLGNDAAKRRKVPVIIDDDEDDIQLVE
jgi:hypothetical protein